MVSLRPLLKLRLVQAIRFSVTPSFLDTCFIICKTRLGEVAILFQGFSSSILATASVSVLGDLFETGVPARRA